MPAGLGFEKQSRIGSLPGTVIEHHLFPFLTTSDMVNIATMDRWMRKLVLNSKILPRDYCNGAGDLTNVAQRAVLSENDAFSLC